MAASSTGKVERQLQESLLHLVHLRQRRREIKAPITSRRRGSPQRLLPHAFHVYSPGVKKKRKNEGPFSLCDYPLIFFTQLFSAGNFAGLRHRDKPDHTQISVRYKVKRAHLCLPLSECLDGSGCDRLFCNLLSP